MESPSPSTSATDAKPPARARRLMTMSIGARLNARSSRLAVAGLLLMGTSGLSAQATSPLAPAKFDNALVVMLSGLPAGAMPTAKVTGPKQSNIASTGYSRTLRKTTTIKGLVPGTYTISVQVVNFAGSTYRPDKTTGKATVRKSGPTSFKVNFTKLAAPATAPDPVTNLVVVPGVNKLTVRWVTPLKQASSYSLATSPGGATCALVKSPCDITGLSPLTTYTVTITASNGAGKTATTTSEGFKPLQAGQSYVDGNVIGPGVNLTGARLVGSRLTGVNLTGANLTGADLTGANLTGADLSYTNLTGVNLTAATLKSVKSGSITGTPTGALPTGWILTKGYLVGPGANLADADLSDADLSGARLIGTLFSSGSNLTNADLRQVSGKDLRGVSFANATLINAKLAGLNLSGSTLKSARLTGADLSGSDLSSVALGSANLVNANLSNAILTGADLTSTTLTGATIAGATMTGIITKSVNACGLIGQPTATSSGTAVVTGCLVGPRASLVGADFTGADLRGLNLSGANLGATILKQANLSAVNLTGATITGADFTGATLTGIQATGLTGTPKANTLPAGWVFDSKTGSILPSAG